MEVFQIDFRDIRVADGDVDAPLAVLMGDDVREGDPRGRQVGERGADAFEAIVSGSRAVDRQHRFVAGVQTEGRSFTGVVVERSVLDPDGGQIQSGGVDVQTGGGIVAERASREGESEQAAARDLRAEAVFRVAGKAGVFDAEQESFRIGRLEKESVGAVVGEPPVGDEHGAGAAAVGFDPQAVAVVVRKKAAVDFQERERIVDGEERESGIAVGGEGGSGDGGLIGVVVLRPEIESRAGVVLGAHAKEPGAGQRRVQLRDLESVAAVVQELAVLDADEG